MEETPTVQFYLPFQQQQGHKNRYVMPQCILPCNLRHKPIVINLRLFIRSSGGFPHFHRLVSSNPVQHIFLTQYLLLYQPLARTRGVIIFSTFQLSFKLYALRVTILLNIAFHSDQHFKAFQFSFSLIILDLLVGFI